MYNWQRLFFEWFLGELLSRLRAEGVRGQAERVIAPRASHTITTGVEGPTIRPRTSNHLPRPGQVLLSLEQGGTWALGDTQRHTAPFMPLGKSAPVVPRPFYQWGYERFLGAYAKKANAPRLLPSEAVSIVREGYIYQLENPVIVEGDPVIYWTVSAFEVATPGIIAWQGVAITDKFRTEPARLDIYRSSVSTGAGEGVTVESQAEFYMQALAVEEGRLAWTRAQTIDRVHSSLVFTTNRTITNLFALVGRVSERPPVSPYNYTILAVNSMTTYLTLTAPDMWASRFEYTYAKWTPPSYDSEGNITVPGNWGLVAYQLVNRYATSSASGFAGARAVSGHEGVPLDKLVVSAVHDGEHYYWAELLYFDTASLGVSESGIVRAPGSTYSMTLEEMRAHFAAQYFGPGRFGGTGQQQMDNYCDGAPCDPDYAAVNPDSFTMSNTELARTPQRHVAKVVSDPWTGALIGKSQTQPTWTAPQLPVGQNVVFDVVAGVARLMSFYYTTVYGRRPISYEGTDTAHAELIRFDLETGESLEVVDITAELGLGVGHAIAFTSINTERGAYLLQFDHETDPISATLAFGEGLERTITLKPYQPPRADGDPPFWGRGRFEAWGNL